MILFTKEVFIQIKSLTCMYITAQISNQFPGQTQALEPVWQVFIQGSNVDPNNQNGLGLGMPDFSVFVNCASREDAYRVFGDLAKQIVDSGTIPELNSKLMDDVLKGDVK
jgi:hypothetical protein